MTARAVPPLCLHRHKGAHRLLVLRQYQAVVFDGRIGQDSTEDPRILFQFIFIFIAAALSQVMDGSFEFFAGSPMEKLR